MAIKLIAVLPTLLLSHGLPELAQLRDLSWLRRGLKRLSDSASAKFSLLIMLGVPLLICMSLQYTLHGFWFGFSSFAFTVIVLFCCWGPGDLEREIEVVVKAPDSERRLLAAQALRPLGSNLALPLEATALVEASFQSALQRWFGVLFWFVVLGPTGALLYRLIQMLAFDAMWANDRSAAQIGQIRRFAHLLDWLPLQLMTLALALVSDFDAVFRTWHDYHAAPDKEFFSLEPGLLATIARASVDADVSAGDGYAEDGRSITVQLQDALHLLHRILVLWLTVLALLVLAGWVI